VFQIIFKINNKINNKNQLRKCFSKDMRIRVKSLDHIIYLQLKINSFKEIKLNNNTLINFNNQDFHN